jgi:hypothetical protein
LEAGGGFGSGGDEMWLCPTGRKLELHHDAVAVTVIEQRFN